jgi:hypothetical protein
MEKQIKAKDLRAGMILRIGNGIAYPVEKMGLPFFADGTVRIQCKDLTFPFAINENAEVTVLNHQ